MTRTAGVKNVGGTYEEFYIADVEDVLTWPTKAASPTTPADKINYTGAFAMKSTKKFVTIKSELGYSEVKWEAAGPRGGKGFKHMLETFAPENSASNLGVLSLFADKKVVLIGKDRTGVLRVVGSKLLPAVLESANGTTGKKMDDDPGAGNTIVFSTEDNDPPAIYTGEIPLTPAIQFAMAKWTDKYELVGIQPGVVVLKNGNKIDFSNPELTTEMVDDAFKTGTQYLKLKKEKANSKPAEQFLLIHPEKAAQLLGGFVLFWQLPKPKLW